MQYQLNWREDFWTLLKAWIIAVASYLSIMGWIVYITVTMGYGVKFLEALAGRSRDGSKKGIDLVKLFSLSIYNLDDPPTFARIVIVTMTCFIIISICLINL